MNDQSMNALANTRFVRITEEMLADWNRCMFPDDMDEYMDYGEPQELPEEVFIGLDARDRVLTPMFTVADARVTAEALNRYLVEPLEPWEVLRILNLDFWDFSRSITILPRKQRYVIALLETLAQRVDRAQRRRFRAAMRLMFKIDAITYKSEAAKVRHACVMSYKKRVVNSGVLAALASLNKELDEARMSQFASFA